jgi:transposase-like protein
MTARNPAEHLNGGRLITPQQLQMMQADYEAGNTIESIATRYGYSSSAVGARLASVTLIRSRNEMQRSYTPEQEQEILRLMQMPGAKKARVARQVGVSPHALQRCLDRQRAPVKPVVLKPKRPISKPDQEMVPSQLLVVFIQREVRRRDGRSWWANTGLNHTKQVCRDCGISQRLLYLWSYGILTTTKFDTADRVLIGLGCLWWEVFDPQQHKPLMLKSRQRDDVLAWLDVVDRASRLWEGEVLLGPDDPKLDAERKAALEWAA